LGKYNSILPHFLIIKLNISMIVLRNKQFAMGYTFGGVNIYRALGKGAGASMNARERLNQAAMGVGKLGLTALAAKGAYDGLKTTSSALKGNMGKENEYDY
jgi:hypothetical protein